VPGESIGRHVIEALGKTRVVVEDGKVVEVGEPEVGYCPLFAKHRGIQEITPEIVRENVEFRIRDFGMCTEGRKMRMKDFLSFGVSELMGMALTKGMIDCTVIVCEGAGTVIVTDPELAQGIGGRISGIVETSPIESVINAIGRERVLDPKTAKIDQVQGVTKAVDLGFRKIGVSVATGKDAETIRKKMGESAVIFAVHTSKVSASDAIKFLKYCDIVTACASKEVRALMAEMKVMRYGNKVPIYAVSEVGEKIMTARLEQMKTPLTKDAEDPPRPLI
jgi:putative methanogenesis marker protein 8